MGRQAHPFCISRNIYFEMHQARWYLTVSSIACIMGFMARSAEGVDDVRDGNKSTTYMQLPNPMGNSIPNGHASIGRASSDPRPSGKGPGRIMIASHGRLFWYHVESGESVVLHEGQVCLMTHHTMSHTSRGLNDELISIRVCIMAPSLAISPRREPSWQGG